MKKATFFFRNGGIIVTQVSDARGDVKHIGRLLCAGGFTIGQDSFWGKDREVAINLADVSLVIIECDE